MEENEGEKIEFQEGLKPVPGIPSNFGQGTTIFQTDENGKITRINTSGAPLDTRNVKTKEEYENPVRVGDYYYAPNRTIQVWENSPTDILQKTKVAVGGTEKPADTVSLKNEGLGILGGAAIGSILPGPAGVAGAIVGGIAGGLNAHNAAAEEALKQWQEQDVKYDSAVEFYKDNDGTVKYKIDYQKMGEGGPRSGEWVKEAQNRETEVKLGDDGRLKVKVSPIFASTERFQELMDYISENYGSLNKDTENLDEVLTEIKNGIDGEAQDYVTNMKLYADFAHRFPNASPETIVASYTTEVAGYVDPAKMGDYQVSVLEGDQIGVRSAKEFFDSVLQMDKGKRNEITKRLNDIVYGDTGQFNDDQRAIAYGELQALFVASANTEGYENDPYQGMMDADPFVSFLNNFAPLGLNGSDVVSFLSGGTFSKQEYLNQNDFAEFLGGAAGIAAGFGLWKGGTKLTEAALKRLPGSAQLFNASVTGQGSANLRAAIAAGETGQVAKMWGTELGFKMLKIGTFDAALAGSQTLVSGKDFWSEFGQDFARDAVLEAIFSYYDMIQFQKAVTDDNVYVYTDPKTGKYKKLDVDKGGSFSTYEMDDDGLVTETKYEQVAKINVGPSGEGKMVGVIQTPKGTTVKIVGDKVQYTSGEGNVVEGTIVESPAGEIPNLATGVVNTDPVDEVQLLKAALKREGLPEDTEVFSIPSQQADSAIIAGKIAKIQGEKIGLETYKQLFNKNGVLDMANNLALAKDGDQNAWRHAQEQFVSVAQNAQNNIQDIQNGIYVKEAAPEWQKTLEVMGGFNYEYKYKPKTDGAYINAINQMQRAQLLNDSREEGDTTDYVAKAREVYGPTIDSMPQDRAEALQGWLEQGKKWLKVFNQSVRKSGKVDVKKLDSFTDTDIEETIGYFPVWAKRTSYRGLLDRFNGISQQRNPYKEWLRDGEWVPLKELEDPYTAMTRYMGFMANNMGLNDMIENAVDVLERGDLLIDNTPSEATVREAKLNSIKNKDELTKKLDKMVEAKKKEVEEATLTPKQYNDAMTEIYEASAIEETVDALNIDLLGTKRYALQTDYDDGGTSLAIREKRQKIVDLDEDIKITEQRIERYNKGASWETIKIPEVLNANAKKNLKKLQQQYIKDGKKAATELGYTGGFEEFNVWSKNKLEQMRAERDDLVTEVLKVRGQKRPVITFEGELYSSSEVPTEYISKRSERQKISDDILGVWNSYNGGLANAWLNEGDTSVKKELRETIEKNPKLRAALLSTMYDNSGSKLPYEKWLNTPITITRQQEVDSLRPEDAFLSFSMQKNWQGMGGLTPRLDNVPGDMITLKVKPKDTLGEIPKGIEAEDEQEVIVPREVYATAMTGFEDVPGERWNDFWKGSPAQTVYEIVDSKGIKYTDGNEYAKGIKAGDSRNVAGYEKFGEEKLERISEGELSPEEEKFSLLFVRPGGTIDQFNGLVRDGIYKDSKELATDIIDAFINGELGYYSSEIETPDEVIEQIAHEYFPEEQKKAEAFLDDTDAGDRKYFDSLRDIAIEKLTKAIDTGNYKLTSPTVLHRGISTGGNKVNRGGDFSWAKEGKTFNDSGLAFVSLSDDVAKGFAMDGSGEKYVLDYYLPTGTSLFYFGKAKKGMGSGNGGAFVLPPVKNAKVGGITVDENGLKHVSLVFDGQYKEKRTKSPEEQQWDEFWKNAPSKTRKDIRKELEKTSLQTGYGISDTRARLNAQVPGFDITDWSLLGRHHVNGLAPEIGYAYMQDEVKAYIMSIDQVRKLLGYPEKVSPAAKNVLEHRLLQHINTKNGNVPIPVTLSGNTVSDKREFFFNPRGGHSMGNAIPTDAHLNAYLETLQEKGIEKIPIVISANNGLPGMVDTKFDLSEKVEDKLGELPQDITTEVQQAFSENGQIPFFHSQGSPLGSIEYNDPDKVPSNIYDGAGDAYWLAPNSSYTDTYGQNKIVGTIPIKYFMSDKEKNELVGKLREELLTLDRDILPTVEKKYFELKKWLMFEVDKGETAEAKKIREDSENNYIASVEKESVMAYDILRSDSYTDAQKKKAAEFLISRKYIDDIPIFESELERLPKDKLWKDVKKAAELKKIVDSVPYEPVSGNFRDKMVSYRALAEYAGKPVIDISEDGFADGTAFFYYKGVSPEFDEEIGQQLAAQALFDRQNPQWTGDTIADAMEEYDGMSLDEMIDNVTTGQGFGEGWDDLFEQFNAGEISSSELSEEVLKFFKGVEKRYPGIGKVMQATWYNNTVQDLRDMKFKYWHPSTGLPTIADNAAAQFLEEMGERPPQAGEPIPEGQTSMWDAINPTNFANVPTEPQFKQPYVPTYEDYQKGLQADPSMAGRVQDSYRGALAQKLVKEASRVVGLATDYLKPYAWDSDWESYLNTSLIPDLRDAINQNMLPEEFQNFVQARMVQAIQDVAPYQSPELILQSQLENVAQEWHDWAVKHIKSGRVSQKELKDFVNSHNLELPNDKRPYPAKVKHALWQMVENGKKLPKIEGFKKPVLQKKSDVVEEPSAEIESEYSIYTKESKEKFYKALDETPLFRSTVKDKNELVDLVAFEKNQETTDAYTMGVSATALGLGSRYPITWYKNGEPYTRFIKADTKEHKYWAEQATALFNDKELVKEEGLISRFFSGAANDFRLLTTGWDPSRTFSNVTRDTSRSFIIGVRFINTKNTLQSVIDAGNYTPKRKAMLKKAIENAAKQAANSSYNSAFRSSKGKQVEITKEYLSNSGASPFKRFMYNLAHDKRSLFEWPMEFFEGYSRRANARSLAAVQLGKDQAAGKSFDEQLKNAVDAANFAGREYTANFQRKGKTIGAASRYVAYLSSSYAGTDGILRAFIDNPKMVTRNFAVFVLAYLILLGDTLSREETRKQYYRLSEYDRENQIVIGMGDSILTIPMDQELAGLLFPYRRIMETLEGTDPASFFEFMWGTFTEWMPMDLSGFSEGDGFNLSRGLEKLTAQNMPTGLTPIQEAATGYDLYYGNDISVSAETLRDYGIYAPQPGDYTTNGKDSLFLRNVANLTGIPQWQLQAMWEGYGGNVGKYVLNTIDKVAGATKEQQGGKDFFDTVFNSFTALDQDAASSVFYDGLNQLKGEKNSLIQKISDYNEKLKTASGDEKIELQNNIQKAKEEYGTKVADFVNKYVNAYDITGGLPKKQAQQIYYLFRLDDDNTVYESGSPEEYYHNQAKRKFENQATALSAPILDKYYNNRMGNIYQDSDGVWRRYLSGGAQAMRNSIYGYGEEQMVNLLNILEGKDSNLTSLRTQVKEARNRAYEAGDWDTRDALSYEFDKKVIEAISPYIEHYGAENVLGNTKVLDYLSDWFFVPDDFIRTKKGKYVSLGNNASTQEAFVRPFIKFVFGLPTNFSSYRDAKYNSLEVGK